MIVRVLRPTTTKPTQAGTPGQEEADVKVVKPLVDEVADANAIEVCIYTQWGNLSQERIKVKVAQVVLKVLMMYFHCLGGKSGI